MGVQDAVMDGAPGRAEAGGAGGAFRLLWRFMRRYPGLCAGTAVALVFDMAGMLLVPTEVAGLINAAVSGGGIEGLYAHGARMLAAALCGSGGAIATALLASRLAANVGRDIRTSVYEASLSLSHTAFGELGTGSMITRTLSDATVIQQTLLMGILMIVPVPVMGAIAFALAFSIERWMGVVLLVVTLAVVGVMAGAVRVSAPIFIRLQGFIDRMNTRLRETITGVRVIRAFRREGVSRERLDETFEEYAENAIRVNLLFSTADSMTFFLMNAVESLILWLGADRVGAHAMQIGSITALIEYAMIIMFFLMMAQFALLGVPRAITCLERISTVLRRAEAPDLAVQASARVPQYATPRLRGDLGHLSAPQERAGGNPPAPGFVFEDVSFRFADADEDTLRDLTFSLAPGTRTAIIGNTGSGKSTIAKLLLRFHDVTAGAVRLDGIDVRELAVEEVRSRIAYVPQRAWLFSGTIADNLRQGNPNATDTDLWRALDLAQAGFVRELPDGLASRVAQGGANFSGGQRQRLAITRALVRRADLYIFDDSFSALDYATDAALRRALAHAPAFAHAAQLIIAQRVSTIRDADQIIVLEEGAVVGCGTHGELLERCPSYRAIAQSQTREESRS